MQAADPRLPWTTHLPDQCTQILSFCGTWMTLYADVRAFVEARAALEREYGQKLQVLTRKLAEKKDRKAMSYCVGDESAKMWDSGMESRSTFIKALTSHLSTLENTATEHIKLADDLQAQVIDELKRGEKKKEESRKKLQGYVQQVVEERDKFYHGREKARSKYFDACAENDSTRLKLEKLPAGDRHTDRYQSSYHKSTSDMNSAKNDYILSIQVANEIKRRFYEVDMPGITSELQTFHAATEHRLSFLLCHTSTIYNNTYTKLSTYCSSIANAYASLDISADQDFYAEFNIRAFAQPPDWSWEPCPGYYADENMVVGQGGGEEMVYLQNRLGRSKKEKERLTIMMNGQRSEIITSRELISSYTLNRGLGDPDDVAETMLSTLRDMTLLAMKQDALAVEVQTLELTLGDEQGAQQPHDFKSTSFTIPTPCDYCKSSIWGISKGGATCKRCGCNVHQKCELKMPSNCQASSVPPTDARSRRTSMAMGMGLGRRDTTTNTASHSRISSISTAVPSDTASTISPSSSHHTLANIRNSFGPRRKSFDTPTSSSVGAPASENTIHLPPPHAMSHLDYSSGLFPMTGPPTGPAQGEGQDLRSPSQGMTTGRSPVIEEESPFESVRAGLKSAVVMWDFEKSDDDEVTVRKGETVHILDHDDGSGWVKVLTAQQGEGLVPAEYVSIQSGGENRMEAHAPGRALPPPASNHGAGMESTSSSSASLANQFGMVVALYDYTATDADETSLVAGQTYHLSSIGKMYGEGWWELMLGNGETKVAPANYLKMV